MLAELGGELRFWRLRMRPGAPVGFGMIGDIPWLGLPGNPVSTMVTFELFARPAIRKICGRSKPFRASTKVTVAEPITLTARLQHFLRVVLTNGRDGLRSKAHRTSRLRHSDLHDEGRRITHRSRRPARDPERRDGPGAGAGQSDAPGTPALLSLFAVSAPGLEELTARELIALGCVGIAAEPGGVAFQGDWETMARANLWLRTASRVLVRFGTFHARALGELERRASLLPWDKYLTPGRPVHLRVTSRKSRLYHQGAIAERIGNGIREVTGTSPESASGNEETSGDEQVVVVRVLRDECLVSLDSSGELLHRRGYRLASSQGTAARDAGRSPSHG